MSETNKALVALVVVLVGEVYLFANAVYALASPKEFLTNRWTRGWRGLPPGTPSGDVRTFGVFLLIGVGFLGFIACKLVLYIWRK
jgi:hypothetical protein